MKPLAGKTGNSNLTENDVRRIRAAGKTTPTRQLAEAYGIGVETVRKILRRDTWQWVTDALGENELDMRARESEARMAKLLELQAQSVETVETTVRELSWTEKSMSPEARARLALFRDEPVGRTPVQPQTRTRVIPPSPLDGGEGGEDETQGVGMKALGERALANDKAREDNASALSGHNANELLKELS